MKKIIEALQPAFIKPSFLQTWNGIAFKPFLAIATFIISLWLMPTPEGLSAQAWHLLILFLATILGVIFKPLPLAAWCLLSLCACIFTKTLTLEQGFGAFGKDVVWLVVFAFFMAKGFIKTGLGSRLAYFFIKTFGKSSLGLTYGFVLTGFMLSPFIPSSTARSGGILFPIVKSVAEEYGSTPEKNTQEKIGSFLLMTVFQADVIYSATFLTSFAVNPLAASLMRDVGVDVTWLSWAQAAIVPTLITLVLLPLLLYILIPPQVKKTPEAPHIAAEQLREMGKLSAQEIIMLITFVLLIVLWILGGVLGINPTTAAMLGVVILLVTGVLSWDDLGQEQGAWTMLVWVAILVGLASNMTGLGVISWFGQHIQVLVSGMATLSASACILLIFFFSHYFFASSAAHASSLYMVFLTAMIGLGVNPLFAGLSLSWASTLSSGLTHYGTGPAPLFFGANYIPITKWWQLGLIVALFILAIWSTIGTAWWYFIGLL